MVTCCSVSATAAAFAASGYAKLTGRPAACFGIAGPGATNLLTGLWDAKMDRVPILALTGQVETQVLVADGQTVVLGGIYETERRETVNKVPFLGDIPYAGVLFRSTEVQNDKAELLIFVTPRILEEGSTIY